MTPFHCNNGRNPRTPLADLRPPEDTPSTAEFIETLRNAENQARDALAIAKGHQERNANRSRRMLEFKENDQVLLSSAHINLASQAQRPSRKLQARFIGPFRIIQKISTVAYKLELPATLNIHPVFHVSLLRPYMDPANVQERPKGTPPPLPTTVNNEIEFEVEEVLDQRIRRRRKEFLVKWAGYPAYDATWEPATNLDNAQEAIKAYEERHPALDSEGIGTIPRGRKGVM